MVLSFQYALFLAFSLCRFFYGREIIDCIEFAQPTTPEYFTQAALFIISHDVVRAFSHEKREPKFDVQH